MKLTGTAERKMGRTVRLVGVACGHGAIAPRCETAPHALRAARLIAGLRAQGVAARWEGTLTPGARERADALAAVTDVCAKLARVTAAIVARGDFPVVLGGDHTCAIGTWKGIMSAQPARKAPGLLWIDAHMDAHTPQTTPSAMLHGMPLACLLGHGHVALTGIAGGALLDPARVCVIGVRSFEPEEAALLERLGVRVIFMDEVARRGLEAVLDDALEIVTGDSTDSNDGAFGITLDLDAIDPCDAPGVGTPEPHGIRAADLTRALARLAGDARLAAVEIVEYNPFRDRNAATAGLITDVLNALLAGRPPLALAQSFPDLEQRYGAHNYDPLPVVLVKGQGVYLWDERGRRYVDMMSAYSAVSHGHCHPRLTRVLAEQSQTLAVTSRAYCNNRLPLLLKRLCELTGQDAALPVNTGLEAVETALKAARKWAVKVKGVPEDRAEIIACEGNFHGRSIAIVAMSSESQYRDGFGPFPPGFKRIPYGDAQALERAITPNTAAFLVEPVQGEAGIIVPPAGYLAACARICRAHNVLLICDEVQTGLGRTGRFLACEHEGVHPDGVILGKALGGGLLPVSAFVARREVMAVFTPGDHGSTFGGNPLAAAVALEALDIVIEERFAERAARLGEVFLAKLRAHRNPLVREVRGRGLLIGVEIDPAYATARVVCERLLDYGILTKDTHGTVVRFAPPLVITRRQLDAALDAIRRCLDELAGAGAQAA